MKSGMICLRFLLPQVLCTLSGEGAFWLCGYYDGRVDVIFRRGSCIKSARLTCIFGDLCGQYYRWRCCIWMPMNERAEYASQASASTPRNALLNLHPSPRRSDSRPDSQPGTICAERSALWWRGAGMISVRCTLNTPKINSVGLENTESSLIRQRSSF